MYVNYYASEPFTSEVQYKYWINVENIMSALTWLDYT